MFCIKEHTKARPLQGRAFFAVNGGFVQAVAEAVAFVAGVAVGTGMNTARPMA